LTPKGVTRLKAFTTRNFVICNHSIHNYMWLFVICNFVLSFLQLITIL
jgi:hypothetical protein